MRKCSFRDVLIILLACIFYNIAEATTDKMLYSCDIDDVGTLTPGDYKTKVSLTHYWQGAVGGVNTKNADRIIGLYDFDLYYLLSAEQAEDNKGDYMMVVVSLQPSFGNGLTDSKAGGPFNLNDGAKGDNVLIDKLFVRLTTSDRLWIFDIGKIEIADLFDSSAVAHCEKSQFFAEPFVHNGAIPFCKHGLGVRALLQPSDFWYFQAAVGDGQAVKRETGFRTGFHDEDYLFSAAEVGISPKFLDLDGTYRFMLWYDPQGKSYLDGSGHTKRDDLGFALSFDQKVNQDTTLFFRYGWADDKVNEFEDFISFGGQVEGLIEGRDKDMLGIAYAGGLRSPYGLSSTDERHIDLVEAYYAIQINDNVIISPNIQLAMDPGGLKSESPATIFGLRCRVKF